MSPPLVSRVRPYVSDGFLLYLLACFLPRLQRAQAIQQQQPGSEKFVYQFNGDFQGIGISLNVDEEGRLIVEHVGRFPGVMHKAAPEKPRAKPLSVVDSTCKAKYVKCRFKHPVPPFLISYGLIVKH